MTRRQYARRQFRRSLIWRVFYGRGELLGQGSIVDVHENGCRVTGRMPVEAGTHLRLCIWPTDNPTDILVVQGTVRWAKGLEFGLLLDANMPNFQELIRQRDDNLQSSHAAGIANS
jgi:PilZ domain-containing protein